MLSLSTVERLKDLNIEYHLQRRHRSSRGVKRNIQKEHPFVDTSFNARSVMGTYMACKRCEISTLIKDNGVDLFFVTETWLSAQGDEAKTVEIAPSGFDVKSFPRQSRSNGCGIATIYKSILGSSITFKSNLFDSHIVRSSAGINYSTAQHTTFFLFVPPSTKPTKQYYLLYVN